MLCGMGFTDWLRGGTIDLVEHGSQIDMIFSALVEAQASGQGGLGVAAIFRARQLNADVPASLPVEADGKRILDTHERVMETILSLQDHGDAYWYLADGDWSVLPYQDMTVTWSGGPVKSRKRVYKFQNEEMRTDSFTAELKVLSINRGANALTGSGWLESDRIRGLIAEQKFSQEYFENSGQPTGVLNAPGTATKDEAQLAIEQWIAARKTRTPAFLSGGMTWANEGFSAQDSEWVGTHLAGVGDVAALSGVPPFFLAYSPSGSSLTYASTSELWRTYWAQTLKVTYVSRIEEAWSDITSSKIRVIPDELLIASLRERADSVGILVRSGFDPESVAEVAGLPPIDHTGFLPVTVQPQSEDQRI